LFEFGLDAQLAPHKIVIMKYNRTSKETDNKGVMFMQNAQEIYNSSIRSWPYDEQLLLAALILDGVRQEIPRLEKAPRQSMLDILDELPGGRIFKTSAEVDAYLREERDSWDR
jgi:hypothetical protein